MSKYHSGQSAPQAETSPQREKNKLTLSHELQSAPILDIRSKLNPQQRQAVMHDEGPLLVLAGAGTGKTRVLTYRLAYLLAERNLPPYEAMAVTFTNKAAREMQQRLMSLLPDHDFNRMLLGTFHALGARIIRQHAECLGLTPNFTILDTDDQLRLIKKIMQECDIDTKIIPVRKIAHHIEQWKNKVIEPNAVSANDTYNESSRHAKAVYLLYQERLLNINAADFGDLLMLWIKLYRQQPAILEKWQERLRHILVDEYQDTNHAQEILLQMLAAKHQNICCVGDEDQSIYSWRGANINHILEFQTLYPQATVIKLEHNYRSTSHILNAASTLISHNHERLKKTLYATGNPGAPVRVFVAIDGQHEAQSILREVLDLTLSGKKAAQIAILMRVAAQTRVFEDLCLQMSIPYVIYGGLRFYEREEIRDCLAYLRLIHQPRDDLAFERIINKPPRGIGLVASRAITNLARRESISAIEAMRVLIRSDELKPASQRACLEFLRLYDHWRELMETVSHVSLLERVLDESSYSGYLKKNDSIKAETKLENIKELLSAMQDFSDLSSFLEHVSLVMDREPYDHHDCLNIMTIHSAKGLEFEHVYLPGWEEGLIPHERAIQESRSAIEEERRLAYVAITRAREELVISSARERFMQGSFRMCRPSRFFDELPRSSIQIVHTDPDKSQRYTQPYQEQEHPLQEGAASALEPGMTCFHHTFGKGEILEIVGDHLATVAFAHTTKTVLTHYLKPTK